MLVGQAPKFVVIDLLVFLTHAVGDDFVCFPRKIQMMAVREMSAVGQVHAENRIPGLNYGGVGGLVGLRAGMGLDVGVFRAEELLGTVPRQVFDRVRMLTAAVVALSRIAFGVLVGEDAASSFQHGLAGKVLARDQFQTRILARGFSLNLLGNFRIYFRQGSGESFLLVHD
jgi:hypothetical protein